MICKEDITAWFKGLEGDERIELMCCLLDCCLPLELRFLGTYIEYAANKHYSNLQRYEKTANDATFGQLKNLHDATIRRKFCIYLALLYSHNKRAATDLFQFLEHFEPNNGYPEKENNLTVNGVLCSEDDTYMNEIKLLFSMGSYHPAFTFQQKEILRSKFHDQKNNGKNHANPKLEKDNAENAQESQNKHIQKATEESTNPQETEQKKDSVVSLEKPRETIAEGIKRSPQISKGLNEISLSSDFSKISLASGNVHNNPITRMPLVTEATPNHHVEQFQYQPLPIPAIFPQNPSLLGMPFQNVQGMQPPLAVYPTSPRSQVPPNLQSVIVNPTSIQGKPGGVAQGPNGIIHTIYPTQMFGSPAPPPSPSVGRNPSEYRFASSPIPVRPTRLYRPMNQGLNTCPQPVNYGYNMSPYQSPMDSPVTSPFTSPSPSPKSSPLPSPRLSPYPSPAESPMFRRKFPSGSLPGRKNSEQYASVFDWLKSLRLHKYAEVFKDFTFDQMKALSDADLSRLGLTQGARKKFSLHISNLVDRGFKGFANQLSLSESTKFVSSTGAVSMASKTSQNSDINPDTYHASGVTSAPGTVSFDKVSSEQRKQGLEKPNVNTVPSDYVPRQDEHFIEKSSDDGSQSTSESVEDLTSDDEVFMTRRPTVIENKDCTHLMPSCYNCGSKDHFGEQCIEATMEEETIIRYGYHLNYSSERLKENKR